MLPILKVDLTTGKHESFEVPAAWRREYLGGASLAARLLYRELVPGLDALSPEAPLLFLTGPLTGTAGPAVGRFVIAGRSPATGLWAESNCGGFWGPELRRAGFDGLWISGRAPEPLYLWIQDGRRETRPAGHLWGMDTYTTQDRLKAELGRARLRTAVIGPAGEAGLPFALILCDHGRVAGRTGLGAVMGAKNLKAIAVQGQGVIPVAHAQPYQAVRAAANRALRDVNFSVVLRDTGSAGGSDYFDYLGEMPKRYFQKGEFAGAGSVSGSSLSESLLTGVSTCHGCVIACGRVVSLEDGEKRKGPEYETIVGFGPNLWIDDLAFTVRMGELCDRYGMDTISMSNTLGLAFTLFEQGYLSAADTGGLALRWGDMDVVEQLLHLTPRKSGFGALLAQGARGLARHFGAEELAMQVNGLEMAYHDPRGASGMALVYATSPRGACHNQSDYFLADIGQTEESLGMAFYPRQAGAEKARNVQIHQDWRTVCNALVLCFFANVPPRVTLELVNGACGLDFTLEELLRCGERAWNLKRAINVRFGLSQENDTLPEAMSRPYPDGGSAGYTPDLPGMLAAYYRARGWDSQTGKPSRAKLLELGLGSVAGDLWPEN